MYAPLLLLLCRFEFGGGQYFFVIFIPPVCDDYVMIFKQYIIVNYIPPSIADMWAYV